MAINFPTSPSIGDTFTSNGRSWQYNGTAWVGYGNLPDPSVFAVDPVNDDVNVYGTLGVSASASIAGNLEVDGNFTVSGTTTTINTTELNVEDNIVTLNYGVTGTPTLDAGIEVERGDLANTSITWDESAESWVVGGTAYVDTANSRVGIGTTSTSYALTVAGDIQIIDSSPHLVFTDTDTGGDSRITADSSNGSLILQADYNNEVAGTNIVFSLDNSERMRIDSSGNVGIGTTSPTGTVDINGNTSTLVFTSPSNTNRYRIDANMTDAVDYGLSVGYWDGAAYQRTMTFTDNGRVGIGTISPANPLEIYGGTADAVLHVGSGDAGSYITFADSTTTGAYWRNRIGINGNDLRFDTDFTNRMTISSSGNVGIGTTSPDSLLEVNGEATATSLRLTSTADASATSTTHAFQIGDSVSQHLKMDTNELSSYTSTTPTDLFFNVDGGAIYVGGGATSNGAHIKWIPSGNNSTFARFGYPSTGQSWDYVLLRATANSITNDSSDYGFSVKYMGSRAGNNNSLSIFADNQAGSAVEAMTINQNGDVGIGDSNPQYRLEVVSTDADTLYLRSSTNGSGTRIRWTDHSTEGQNGYLKYVHSDGQSYGHGNAFIFDSTEATMTVVSTDDFTAVGTLTQNYSDERLKVLHGTIPDALSKLSGIRGYLYTQNEIADSLGFKEVGVQQVGVSAQEVMEVMPEVVTVAPISYTDKTEEEYYTVRYERMVPLLIEAIHELTARIEVLEAG